jgi:hypothetical protein
MRDDEKSIKIFTLDLEDQALLPLIEDAFAKEQIDFRMRSSLERAYDGIYTGQKGLGDIYVFEKDKERALQILNDILSAAD